MLQIHDLSVTTQLVGAPFRSAGLTIKETQRLTLMAALDAHAKRSLNLSCQTIEAVRKTNHSLSS
jgi:hypothetical protein